MYEINKRIKKYCSVDSFICKRPKFDPTVQIDKKKTKNKFQDLKNSSTRWAVKASDRLQIIMKLTSLKNFNLNYL